MLRVNNASAGLRQSEIRDSVQAYFKAQLDQYLDWLDRRGLSKNALEDVPCEMLDHKSYLDMEMESDQYLPVKPVLRKSGLTAQDWQSSQPMMQRELRKGRRDLLRAVLAAAEHLEHYSYDDPRRCPGYRPFRSCARSASLIAFGRGNGRFHRRAFAPVGWQDHRPEPGLPDYPC